MTAVRAAVVAVVLAGLALAAVLVGLGSSPYEVRAQFDDASQLVRGDLVQIAGRRVGTVSSIDLTSDNRAEITLRLEGPARPLREGTHATVRTVGLSGVTNRYVELTPGPDTLAEIPDGGVIPSTHTRGVVDLDAMLNAFDPEMRRDVQHFVRDAAAALTPEAAKDANAGLAYLNPAMAQLTDVGRELTRDEPALRTLVARTSSLASALAEHRAGLAASIESTAGVLETLAGRTEELTGTLDRAPRAMGAATSLLRRVRAQTLPALDPVLDRIGPTLDPAETLLRRLPGTLRDAAPLVAGLRELVPQARAELEPLPALARAAAPAMVSIARSLEDALPMIRGLRPYAPDLVAGFFLGFGGSTAGTYDANGHMQRIQLEAGPQTLSGTPPADANGYRTGLDARCPGSAEEPAFDGSNPWFEGGGTACNPDHAMTP